MSGSSGIFSLERFLEQEAVRASLALGRAFRPPGGLAALPEALQAPILHTIQAGGKRIRPILCVTAFQASGGTGKEIYDLAAPLELIHAYSLMHDDLPCMDDGGLRRGVPTAHTVHGEELTMVAGAALIPGAALHAWQAASAMGLEPEVGRELVRALLVAAGGGGMVGGQALDLLGEGTELGEEELDQLHRLKTGALLVAALRMGGLAARAGQEVQAALEEYGRRIGLAFQIADDVLDVTSDSRSLGKNPSDEALKKSTYVTHLGVEGARTEARREVRRARAALREAGLQSPALEALAGYVVARKR